MTLPVIHCVSVSGGKDSAATAILALETQPRESLRFAFADTGNEHASTIEYVAYMARHLGIEITTLPQPSFADRIVRKREYVREHWPRKGVSKEIIEIAVAALVPTGNPFLDLCIWKGRFPSRRAQFCTQELKTIPLVEHQMGFIERGEAQAVWSWQGVRLDESAARKERLQGTGACVRAFDVVGGGLCNYRPILRWTAADAFEAALIYRLEPNPLYRQNMTRVGCMPCINASKDEVLEISKRLPRPHRPHCLLGALRRAGEPKADGELLPGPRPRRAPEQARHSQCGGVEQDAPRRPDGRLDQGSRGAQGVRERVRVVRMKPEDAQQSGCAGKGRFPTQQQAAERAQRMRQRHGNNRPATVYHWHCGAWHIGGKSRPVSAEHVRKFKRLRAALRDGGA